MRIPERQIIYETLKSEKKALQRDEITALLKLDDEQVQAVHKRLDAMVRDGQLICNAQERYQIGHEAQRVRGVFIASGRSKTVKLEVAGETYLELPLRLTHGLVDGDRLEMHLLKYREEGEPVPVAVEILERDREVVGIVTAAGYVEPLHEIGPNELQCIARKSKSENIATGSVVIMHLSKPEFRSSAVAGEIVELLGDRESAGMEVDIVLRAYGIPGRWRHEAMDEAERCAPVSKHDIVGREDLREMSFVTIDGEDAKDFDDAIFFEKHGDGWRLWVAIADVASYVKPGSALDAAAYERGNSVYFPGRVVPMLPSLLSDGLCSLRPDEDRLALVCRMTLSAQGEITGHEFMRAVIRSQARLTYTQVGGFLQNGKGLQEHSPQVCEMLRESERTFQQLLAQRQKRGALELDMIETRMLFDEQKMIRKIIPFIRNDAHRLIEECMICANICAAKFLAEHNHELLYRTHAGLKQDTVDDLKFFLRERGLTLRGESNLDLALLLREVVDRDDTHAVQSVILRSLARALYQPDNIGHYGLALDHYAHFTSPIRRYPDLLVHRAIHAVLDDTLKSGKFYKKSELKGMGEHCSMTEKRADDATRDVEKYLKCLYIKDQVGEKLTGIIVGVTNFGLFLELKNIYVEGLLHISSLDSDYYHFDKQGHRLVGESSGKVYRLGDQLEVVLASVVPEERKVDFVLGGQSGRPPRRRRKR